jgi:beta-aspartyl-peptidase (threonine type)
MLQRLVLLLLLSAASTGYPQAATPMKAGGNWALAIHGGAGVIERGSLTLEQERAYRASLLAALDAGSAVLKRGGTSLDAVEAVIRVLEDDPLFNAGRGAVFTAEGRNELDASIMDGQSRRAGAIAGVTRTRHPISLARAVMDKSRHVMLAREGADQFRWSRASSRWTRPGSAPNNAGSNCSTGGATMPGCSTPRIRAVPWARSPST